MCKQFRGHQGGDNTKHSTQKLGLVWRTLKWLLITWHWSQIEQENGKRNRSVCQVGRDWAGAIWQARGMMTRDGHTPPHQFHNKAFTRIDLQWNERWWTLGKVIFFLDLRIRLQIRTQNIWSNFIFILCYYDFYMNGRVFPVTFFYVQTNLLKLFIVYLLYLLLYII